MIMCWDSVTISHGFRDYRCCTNNFLAFESSAAKVYTTHYIPLGALPQLNASSIVLVRGFVYPDQASSQCFGLEEKKHGQVKTSWLSDR